MLVSFLSTTHAIDSRLRHFGLHKSAGMTFKYSAHFGNNDVIPRLTLNLSNGL